MQAIKQISRFHKKSYQGKMVYIILRSIGEILINLCSKFNQKEKEMEANQFLSLLQLDYETIIKLTNC